MCSEGSVKGPSSVENNPTLVPSLYYRVSPPPTCRTFSRIGKGGSVEGTNSAKKYPTLVLSFYSRNLSSASLQHLLLNRQGGICGRYKLCWEYFFLGSILLFWNLPLPGIQDLLLNTVKTGNFERLFNFEVILKLCPIFFKQPFLAEGSNEKLH